MGGDRQSVQQSHRCPSNGCYSMARWRMHQILDRPKSIDRIAFDYGFLRRIDSNTIGRRPTASKAQERGRRSRSIPVLLLGGRILLHPLPEQDRCKTQARPDRSRQIAHHSDAHDLPFRFADIQWKGVNTWCLGSGVFPSAAMVVIRGKSHAGPNRADP